jgi:general secretion pathway protein I
VSSAEKSRAPTDGGFSLVEALVALGVFATAGVALMQLQAQSIQTLTRVETRTLAGIVAQNQLVELTASIAPPTLGDASGEVELGNRRWRWRRELVRTADPNVWRATVRVSELKEGGDETAVGGSSFAFLSISGGAP